MKKVLSTLIFSLLISSCYSESDYTGDGKLIHNGPRAVNNRYVLNLGDIDFNSVNNYDFKLANLPSKQFIIGFNIESPNILPEDTSRINNAQISIKLTNLNGTHISNWDSNLNSWTWSVEVSNNYRTYVYNRDHSYFTPEKNAGYQLTLAVTSPNTLSIINHYNSQLILKTGGWK